MRIRDAVAGDVAAIVGIGQRTWPPTYAFAGPDYIAHGLATWWSPAAVGRSLTGTTVLVAEAPGGGLTGMGNIDLRGEVPVIWKLYVLPEAQGTGAGSALLRALVGRAPGRPVTLEYAEGNERAARFYRARGFREWRREPGTPPGSPETVWMRREPD